MGYTKGQLIRCAVKFQTYILGVLTDVDPTNVYFKYKRPGASTITYTYNVDAALVKDSTGNYHVDVDTSLAHGKYYCKFYSTGTYQAAAKIEFCVDRDSI